MDVEAIYRREVRKRHLRLSAEDERRLHREFSEGSEKARLALLDSLLPMVLSIARRYRHRGVDTMDLIQAGNEGAMRGVDGFDPSKGRLSTTAHYWILAAIRAEWFRNRSTIRVPTEFQDGTHDRKDVFTDEYRNEVRARFLGIISLDMKIAGRSDGSNIGSFLKSDSPGPVDQAIEQERNAIEQSMIARLPERLRRIVEMRLGGMLLREIGENIGRTKEAVRLSFNQAVEMLQKMRPLEKPRSL